MARPVPACDGTTRKAFCLDMERRTRMSTAGTGIVEA